MVLAWAPAPPTFFEAHPAPRVLECERLPRSEKGATLTVHPMGVKTRGRCIHPRRLWVVVVYVGGKARAGNVNRASSLTVPVALHPPVE